MTGSREKCIDAAVGRVRRLLSTPVQARLYLPPGWWREYRRYYPFSQPRPGHPEALRELWEKIAVGERPVVLRARTGWGKTAVIAALAARLRGEGYRVAIVEPERALVYQTLQTVKRVVPEARPLVARLRMCAEEGFLARSRADPRLYSEPPCAVKLTSFRGEAYVFDGEKIVKKAPAQPAALFLVPRYAVDPGGGAEPVPAACEACPFHHSLRAGVAVLTPELLFPLLREWRRLGVSKTAIIVDEADVAAAHFGRPVKAPRGCGDPRRCLREALARLQGELEPVKRELEDLSGRLTLALDTLREARRRGDAAEAARAEWEVKALRQRITGLYRRARRLQREAMHVSLLLERAAGGEKLVVYEFAGSAYVEPFFEDGLGFLSRVADVVVLVSATLPGDAVEAQGLEFRHRTLYVPVSKYTLRSVRRGEADFDGGARLVEELVNLYAENGFRGKAVVHTGNNSLHRRRVEEALGGRYRIYKVSDGDVREKVIEAFRDAERGVLLGAGFEFGQDFPDTPVNVIFKVPFPDLSSAPVKARLKADPELFEQWYARKTVARLVQAAGRNSRRPGDPYVTVILDAAFQRLLDRHRELFPKWFLDELEHVDCKDR